MVWHRRSPQYAGRGRQPSEQRDREDAKHAGGTRTTIRRGARADADDARGVRSLYARRYRALDPAREGPQDRNRRVTRPWIRGSEGSVGNHDGEDRSGECLHPRAAGARNWQRVKESIFLTAKNDVDGVLAVRRLRGVHRARRSVAGRKVGAVV